jgi:hypothetical protein
MLSKKIPDTGCLIPDEIGWGILETALMHLTKFRLPLAIGGVRARKTKRCWIDKKI